MKRSTSIRTRVIVLTVAMTVLAVAVTAYLASSSTESALRDQAAKSLEVDASIYQALAEYGQSHPNWNAVGPLVRKLATRTQRRITLADDRGRVLSDSAAEEGSERPALPAHPTARLDPLNPALNAASSELLNETAPTTSTSIAPEALANAESCLKAAQINYTIDPTVDGNQIPSPTDELDEIESTKFEQCTQSLFPRSPAEVRFEQSLEKCLQAGQSGPTPPTTTSPEESPLYDECLRQAQAAGSAEAVAIYISGRSSEASPFGDSALPKTLPLVIALIIGGAIASWLVARRLTLPLTRLTTAANALASGELSHRVEEPAGSDEITVLTNALNSLAVSLERTEFLRKQMVSDVAHELRNPINTMSGTLEAIADGVYPASAEVLGSLVEEANHLAALVNDLQDLAAADAGGTSIHLDHVDLCDLVRSLAETHRPVIERDGISLHVEINGATAAWADGPRLRQVLDNLLSNARRHTPSGGSITIAVDDRRISVTDTGEGIPEENLTNVFERFWRADSSRARATGGTGLGLAIAQELVRAHGAELTVSSQIGAGSTFSISGLSASNGSETSVT